jgi:chromosome segregation ATPase
VRDRLEDKEKLLDTKEKEIVSLASMQSKNSGEVDVLNTLIESKEKQITSLKEKVPCFEYSLQYALVPHILSFLIYMQAV